MIHRPPPRDGLLYAGLALGCLALLIVMAVSFIRKPGPGKQFAAYKLGGVAMLAGFGVYLNWLHWTSRIRVDDAGVRWREGKNSGSLAWDQIRSLGGQRNGKHVRPCLVDASGRNHLLPFLTPELYRELVGRCGPLPPDIEADLKLGA